jgi:hypothetical protein
MARIRKPWPVRGGKQYVTARAGIKRTSPKTLPPYLTLCTVTFCQTPHRPRGRHYYVIRCNGSSLVPWRWLDSLPRKHRQKWHRDPTFSNASTGYQP